MLVPSPMLPLARLNLEDAADAVEDRAVDAAQVAVAAQEDAVDHAADAAAAKWFI